MLTQYVFCDRCGHKSYDKDNRFSDAFSMVSIGSTAGMIVNNIPVVADVTSTQKYAFCQSCNKEWGDWFDKFMKTKVG